MTSHFLSRRGIALVIVLVFLVLLSGIIIAFLSGVLTQRTFSRTAADAASTQQLADSAVNIVMAQIVDATGTSQGANLTWASQPGMIRTYDSTGTPGMFYKLYSSNAWRVAGSGFVATADQPPTNWNNATNVGIYTDLNAPALVSDTSGPIVVSTTNGSSVSSGTYSAVYPIMNPLAEGSLENPSESVEGFTLTSRPGSAITATGSGSVSEHYDPTLTVVGSGSTANPAPMPVQWLYVLSNGQVVSPSSNNNGVLSFSGTQMSTSNPIVGRIAFWADDDSCKVNINTASEGTYWDVPRVFSFEDIGSFNGNNNAGLQTPGLSICQPVRKEYQRYAGHPATTSLSAVFGNFGLPVPDAPWNGTASQYWPNLSGTTGLSTTGSAQQLDPYYAIAPRVVSGVVAGGTNGSYAGTMLMSGSVGGGSALVPDQDRLYASLDELMFTGTTTNVSGTYARVTNPNTSGTSTITTPTLLTKSVFEKTKFFLTANSNAPEVTLFNTPRISMWPVWDPTAPTYNSFITQPYPSFLTPYDTLAQFCSTTGTGSSAYPFYFTRAYAHSGLVDYDQISRNRTLYKYLQAMTSQNIPGFGGNFASKYQTDINEILTLMFDYIRCINLADSETGAVPFAWGQPVSATGTNRLFQIDPADPGIAPFLASGGDTNYNDQIDAPNLFPTGAGEVIPIQIPTTSGTTRGAGRCLTIAEADLLFYATSGTTPRGGTAQTNQFRAALLLQFASPMEGMSGMRSSLQYAVTGLDQFGVTVAGTTSSLFLPSSGTNQINIADVQTYGGQSVGGIEGPAEGLYRLAGVPWTTGAPPWDVSAKTTYPFVSSTDVIFSPPAAASTSRTFTFNPGANGGLVTITITSQADQYSPSEVVQTINLKFPTGTFKIPDYLNFVYVPPDLNSVPSTTGTSFNQRLTGYYVCSGSLANNQVKTLDSMSSLVRTGVSTGTTGDTMVGIQPAGVAGGGTDPTAGDIRMLAPMLTVPATRYAPHIKYTTSGVQWAHGLTTASGIAYAGATFGTLVSGTYTNGSSTVPASCAPQDPYVPACVGSAVTRANGGPGDWDTGVGNLVDGAFMNKPDEGDSRLFSNLNSGSYLSVPRYPYILNQPGYGFASTPPGSVYFSPNRQVPSPLMFGSIPTGVTSFKPWQTLLFNPKPEDQSHPGLGNPVSGPPFTTPPDYLLADLFWMPVVEPYAISQPFSTAGKINMNYQIEPFTYIKRQTGLYAVMKSTKFLALPPSDAVYYKPAVVGAVYQRNYGMGIWGTINPNRRRSINIPATLSAFDTKFTNNDIYKSAAEICGVNLVPNSVGSEPVWSSTNMAQFWQANNMTGTNVRDKPYVDIYPRLTTKSNTFTVHFWVQSLRQSPVNAAAGRFVDPNSTGVGARDAVVGEYRGSTTIERYIDPNDPRISGVDFASNYTNNPNDPTINMNQYYKFRVVGVKRFSP